MVRHAMFPRSAVRVCVSIAWRGQRNHRGMESPCDARNLWRIGFGRSNMVRRRDRHAFPRGTWGWLLRIRTRRQVKPRLRRRTDFGWKLEASFYREFAAEMNKAMEPVLRAIMEDQ